MYQSKFKTIRNFILIYFVLLIYQFGNVFIFFGFDINYFEILLNLFFQLVFIYLNYIWSLGGEKNEKFKAINFFKIVFVYLIYPPFFYFFNYIIIDSIYHNYYSENNLKQFYFTHSENYLHYLLFSLGFWYYKKSLYKEKQFHQKELENFKVNEQNLQLQIINEQLTKQKIEADYNYLRTQINPHFLYNTLGYFYSKVAPVQPQTAEGILMLTNIMRYSLYQGDELGKVPLKMEIDNLDNYIGLQKMRFGNNLFLEYEKNVDPGNEYKILPHLLITLVENAFKHGNYTKPDHPLKVSITLHGNKLVLKVENLINKAVSELPSTKTGLQNMQNRLLLVYADKQNIEIKNDGNIFSIWMQIELNESIDKVAKESPQSNEAVLNAKPENPNPFYKVAVL